LSEHFKGSDDTFIHPKTLKKYYTPAHVLFLYPGAVRIASAHIKLPLKLIVKPVLPVKNAQFKVTLDTNKQPANLNDIFPGE